MTTGKRHQIAATIRQKITDGVEGYTPGSRLPTIRELAAEYGVSTTTMDVVVMALKAEHLLTGVRGGRLRVRVPIEEPNGDNGPADAA